MHNVEWIGFLASAIILISICFKTTSRSGRLWLRILNSFGSLIFATYGILIGSYSLIFMNSAAAIIGITAAIRERKEVIQD